MPFGGPKPSSFDAPPQDSRPQKINRIVQSTIEERDRYIERKRDDLVWRSLWRADAALKVEEYIRARSYSLSFDEILEDINFAPNAIDREFLRSVSVVADKFREQSDAVSSVLEFLSEHNAKNGVQNSPEALGKLLYEEMMDQKRMPVLRTGMKLRRMSGFILLTVNNEAAYNALYDETTSENRSGGRFHRAQIITIAKRKVPVVVCRGERTGSIEKDPLMIHEIQHWINEGLLGLGFMEKSSQTILQLPRFERMRALHEQKQQRRIKDEVLAYLREGRVADLEKTLLGPLYANLFEGDAEDVKKRKKILEHIQVSLHAFAPLITKYPRIKDILTYMLMPVSFGNIATRLNTIRMTFERTEGIGEVFLPIITRDIPSFLPRAFEREREALEGARNTAQDLQQETIQFLYPFSLSNTKHIEYGDIRDGMRNAKQRAEQAQEQLRHGFHGAHVPYVAWIEGLEESERNQAETEENSVYDVLDTLQQIPKDDIDLLYKVFDEGRSRSAQFDTAKAVAQTILQRVARAIKTRISTDPNVELRVRESGIEISVSHLGNAKTRGPYVQYSANILRQRPREQRGVGDALPNTQHGNGMTFYVRDFDEPFAQEEIIDSEALPKKYASIYVDLQEIAHAIERLRKEVKNQQMFAHCSATDLRIFRQRVEEYDELREQHVNIRQKLFRNNAHIPLVFEPYYVETSSGTIEQNDAINTLMEQFQEDIYSTFDAIDQDKVDAWIDPPEPFEEDWSREAAILDMLQKKIGTQYGKGKIKDIGLDEVDFSQPGRCTITVSFSVKDGTGTWQKGLMNVQLFARKQIRRRVAKV